MCYYEIGKTIVNIRLYDFIPVFICFINWVLGLSLLPVLLFTFFPVTLVIQGLFFINPHFSPNAFHIDLNGFILLKTFSLLATFSVHKILYALRTPNAWIFLIFLIIVHASTSRVRTHIAFYKYCIRTYWVCCKMVFIFIFSKYIRF